MTFHIYAARCVRSFGSYLLRFLVGRFKRHENAGIVAPRIGHGNLWFVTLEALSLAHLAHAQWLHSCTTRDETFGAPCWRPPDLSKYLFSDSPDTPWTA